MSLAAADYQALILAKLAETTGPLASSIQTIWDLHADKGFGFGLYVQYLYAYRESIEFLMGPDRKKVTFANQGELSMNMSDRFKALVSMWVKVNEQIPKEELRAGAARSGLVGQMTTTAPISPPTGAYDANSQALRGDPYSSWAVLDE